jgi:hypothetical protein
MVEYGHGVSEGAGTVAGSQGGLGGSGGGDWGGNLVRVATDAVDTISTLPAEQLLLLIGAIVIGFVLFKRAF